MPDHKLDLPPSIYLSKGEKEVVRVHIDEFYDEGLLGLGSGWRDLEKTTGDWTDQVIKNVDADRGHIVLKTPSGRTLAKISVTAKQQKTPMFMGG